MEAPGLKRGMEVQCLDPISSPNKKCRSGDLITLTNDGILEDIEGSQVKGDVGEEAKRAERKKLVVKKNGQTSPGWWRLALFSRTVARSFLFWNCRGLGSDTAVRALHGLIRNRRPAMIFLSETKMKDHRLDGVRRRMGFNNGFNVSPVGRAGGLSLWWDNSLEVQVLFSSRNVIDALMRKTGEPNWNMVTGVYGTSYREEKAEFWGWMTSFFSPTDIPWLCAGDFNELLWGPRKIWWG